jgi:bifunctional DNase/RNase
MNTNIIKIPLLSLFAYSLSFTVVLSHMHAKDITSLMNQQSIHRLATGDITAKAMGDLHHHIDKTGVKNIQNDTTTAARTRELNPLLTEEDNRSIGDRIHDFMLRFRVVSSLCFHLALI